MSEDWIQVGARVAEYTPGGTAYVRFAVISRLTPTQIVLADGSRYSRRTLRRVGLPHDDTVLQSVTSTGVKIAYTNTVVKNCLYSISCITRNKEARGTVVLDKAERLIELARRQIARMEDAAPDD